MTLASLADALAERRAGIFRRAEQARRPVFGEQARLQTDPNLLDYIWFHEYSHGETGQGPGASHQTGWTGIIARLMDR